MATKQSERINFGKIKEVIAPPNLIEIQRAYESVTRMIENTNDLSRRSVERLGRVG